MSPRHATEDRWGNRRYRFDPPLVPETIEADSVTTILNRGLPKPAVDAWKRKVIVEWAVDNIDQWKNLDRERAIKVLKDEPLQQSRSATSRGTDVHRYIEEQLSGQQTFLPEQYGGFKDAVDRFLEDWKPQPVILEAEILGHKTGVNYAGSCDFLGALRDGNTYVLDWKTGKDLYSNYALQLAAYAKADLWIHEEAVLNIPRIERIGCVLFRENGTYELSIPRPTVDQLFTYFRAVARVAEFQSDHKQVFAPPLPLEIPEGPDVPASLLDELKQRIDGLNAQQQKRLTAVTTEANEAGYSLSLRLRPSQRRYHIALGLLAAIERDADLPDPKAIGQLDLEQAQGFSKLYELVG